MCQTNYQQTYCKVNRRDVGWGLAPLPNDWYLGIGYVYRVKCVKQTICIKQTWGKFNRREWNDLDFNLTKIEWNFVSFVLSKLSKDGVERRGEFNFLKQILQRPLHSFILFIFFFVLFNKMKNHSCDRKHSK